MVLRQELIDNSVTRMFVTDFLRKRRIVSLLLLVVTSCTWTVFVLTLQGLTGEVRHERDARPVVDRGITRRVHRGLDVDDERSIDDRGMKKPLCSFRFYRESILQSVDGYLDGEGTWERSGNGAPNRFRPSACRLRHGPRVPQDELIRCLRRETIRNVVIVGDSNGGRYFGAMKRFLTAGQARGTKRVRCRTTLSDMKASLISYSS